MISMRSSLLLAASVILFASSARAGGPLIVGGPSFGADGKPFTWASMPISYRVDGGPMASLNGTAVVDNAAGLKRVQSMLDVWANVPTAAISFTDAGPILPSGSFTGTDVASGKDFIAVYTSCVQAAQSPIVFDAEGKILTDLGMDPNSVIGFSTPCALDTAAGHITTAMVLLNGRFQDGVDNGKDNFELSADEFDAAITHELGHLLGLHHSQINLEVLDPLNQQQDQCSADDLAGLPLMFPYAACQARSSAGLPVLAPDDEAWISLLYPQPTTGNGKTAYSAVYTTITGTVLFSDGVNPVQDVNVIARAVDDPATPQDESLRTAFSSVSGYLFTGNPGQSVTANYLPCPRCPGGYSSANVGGSPMGTRDVKKIGYFEIPVRAGNYNLVFESVFDGFIFGSGVGPLDLPIAMPGTAPASASSTIKIVIGSPPGPVHVVLDGTPPPSDSFETLLRAPEVDALLTEAARAA
jgi:hypothetical protein